MFLFFSAFDINLKWWRLHRYWIFHHDIYLQPLWMWIYYNMSAIKILYVLYTEVQYTTMNKPTWTDGRKKQSVDCYGINIQHVKLLGYFFYSIFVSSKSICRNFSFSFRYFTSKKSFADLNFISFSSLQITKAINEIYVFRERN